jgi:hypothetical protein
MRQMRGIVPKRLVRVRGHFPGVRKPFLYGLALMMLVHLSVVAQEAAGWTNWGELPGALVNATSAIAATKGQGGVLANAVIGGDGAIDLTDESVSTWSQ